MRNLKVLLSYDGTDFLGWQTQPGRRTVQETLETAIAAVTGTTAFANASGRTDTGVHAVGQVVNFKSATHLTPEVLVKALNAHLPEDVVVRAVTEAAPDFDANRHALRKRYRYVIHDDPVRELFLRRYAWHLPYARLDAEAMAAASRCLVGRHDFHSFETEWPNRKTSVRTITLLNVNRAGPYVWIDVEADGFLYNMVRSIVGTLVNVGRGYWPVTQVDAILRAEDRRQAGPTAPAQGLFLMEVTYPEQSQPTAAE
ncbi:MAG TPA: tRNA pseudouridine(38-40) synthase TruA [Gemmatales bacterium]|nr:tRNA pseudouridine(38-40) synthase TruA [Gemmatales bacterium]HMP61137.1 tRNA pseudouridine(38-40) synthase TruA [Gemmatales bacterium]